MAEFSKEYLELMKSELIPDFCYMDEFKLLLNGCSNQLICEGLGSVGIMNKNDICHLLFMDEPDPIPIEEFILEFRKTL